jgi:hypothetical protein
VPAQNGRSTADRRTESEIEVNRDAGREEAVVDWLVG